MGGIIELPAGCAPFTLEVRRESVFINDGDALVATRGGTDPLPAGGAAMRAAGGNPSTLMVPRENLDAFTLTLEVALAQPAVYEAVREHRWEVTARPSADDDGVRVALGTLQIYGRGPVDEAGMTPCSTVEVLSVDLPAIVSVLQQRSQV